MNSDKTSQKDHDFLNNTRINVSNIMEKCKQQQMKSDDFIRKLEEEEAVLQKEHDDEMKRFDEEEKAMEKKWREEDEEEMRILENQLLEAQKDLLTQRVEKGKIF